jgi:hypothetical protein
MSSNFICNSFGFLNPDMLAAGDLEKESATLGL